MDIIVAIRLSAFFGGIIAIYVFMRRKYKNGSISGKNLGRFTYRICPGKRTVGDAALGVPSPAPTNPA